jgi:hypothetical protein
VGTGCLVLNVLSSADVSFLTPSLGAHGFGQESRYMIMTLVPISLLAVTAFAWSRVTRLCALIFLAGFSAWGLADYVRSARVEFPLEAKVYRTLDRMVAEQLASSPDAVVWCVLSIPSSCALLYAFNRYREPESLRKLPVNAIDGGRIHRVDSAADACKDADACRTPGRDMFIDHGEALPPGAELLWSDNSVGKVSVWRLTKPWVP